MLHAAHHPILAVIRTLRAKLTHRATEGAESAEFLPEIVRHDASNAGMVDKLSVRLDCSARRVSRRTPWLCGSVALWFNFDTARCTPSNSRRHPHAASKAEPQSHRGRRE